MGFEGTTICAVKREGRCAIAGDGQVTLGENTIMKTGARKVRRLYNDRVVVGFAGSVADAFALCEKFEVKLEQHSGALERAAVELALEWRSDKVMRQLNAMLLTTDGEKILLISGTGKLLSRTTASPPSAPAGCTPWPQAARCWKTRTFPLRKSQRDRF